MLISQAEFCHQKIDMPELHTERLILRIPSAEDLAGFTAFVDDEIAMTHLGGKRLPPQEAWRQMCTCAGSWHVQGYGFFSVIERRSGQWIGRIGPWQPLGWPGTEVGWGVLSAYSGKGYAYEAAVASIDYAVDHLGWTDIIHTIDPNNQRSIALAQRLGAVNAGPTALPAPLDTFRVDKWQQSAASWRAGRASLGQAPALLLPR